MENPEKEFSSCLQQLTSENQIVLLNLVRVAEAAENSAKKSLLKTLQEIVGSTPQITNIQGAK